MESEEDYMRVLGRDINKTYEIANIARAKGYDPENTVNIPLAKNMAERVEGLVSVAAPQIMNAGIPKRIKELEEHYGKLDWRVALTITLETTQEKFCKFDTKKEAMETGIRVGLAYLTLGVVASPLEGFVELKVKKRKDGKEYLALMYAGPIRSAGGTAGAVSVVLADYIRKNMGYDVYDPSEKEIRRMVTELYDYHERITNLQYLPSEKEIRFLVGNLPVEIDGDPSEEIEVSNYKDLERIETNRIRSGPCLVLGECVAQKAAKVWSQTKKWGEQFGLEHWSFLQEFIHLQKEIKAKEKFSKKGITPIYTYIQDLVAGRPVLGHPSAVGGFRLRYGRCRTSGYSATAIHPATMTVLNKYLAIGTQLKVERPGKATAITICDFVEGPIVKLNDGSVAMIDTEQKAKQFSNSIKEILFLGDILVSYGDFYNRAHTLAPAGYCEEWWALEIEKETVNLFGTLDYQKLSQLSNIGEGYITKLAKNYLSERPDASTAISLSKNIHTPLHPYYTYHWKTISREYFLELLKWFGSAKIEFEKNNANKIILPKNEIGKRVLELAGVPHLFVNNEFTVIEKDEAEVLYTIFGMSEKDFFERYRNLQQEDTLDMINAISPIKLRDKSGTFIGARMGRPEKAKVRKMDGDPHTLFPVGKEGGKMRSFQSALEIGFVEAEFPTFFCVQCSKETVFGVCEQCGSKTQKTSHCDICGMVEGDRCRHGKLPQYRLQRIDINNYFKKILGKIGMQQYPDLIKGVRGTSNKNHISEHFAKGIIRAKYDIPVNKDGTTRYDMTQLPITHFTPAEIGTPIERIREMGYSSDIHGLELTDEEQVIELFPQDIILPKCEDAPEPGADEILYKTSLFVDELLALLYRQEKFYNLKSEKGLVGQLVVALAPHTSAGIVGRIIGFSKTQGFYAHPLFHAATRRDCLSFDNYVAIQENSEWKIEKIGSYIENSNPTQPADNFGTLKKNVDIGTFSNPGESKVAEITKHAPSKIIKISLEDGRKIELTEGHKVYLKGKIERRACQLKEGDQLMVGYKRDIKEKDTSQIFLPDLFSGRKDVMIRNIMGYLCKFEKLSKHDNFCFRDSFPIKFVAEFLGKYGLNLRDIPEQAKIAIKRDNISLPIKISLDNDLLEVIGLYISEGYIRKNVSKKSLYQISIAGNEEIRSFVKKTFCKHFGLMPSHENSDQVVFSSRIIYELFHDYLKAGHGAKSKRIPSLFLNLKKEKLAALLRGYFEGDGSVSSTDIRVCCDTVSEGLKHDLSFVLSRFGIFTKFYEYEKEPGQAVKDFYIRKSRKIPKFKITKITILSNFVKKFREIGFLSERKNKILDIICKKEPYGTYIDVDGNYAYPTIKKIEDMGEKTSYCFNVAAEHNFFANDILVHNCDGDEASVTLLMDALLNFSRQFLPNTRGATQDAPLVLTSTLNPNEVDDMAFDLDIMHRYTLELYEAAQRFDMPSNIKIDRLADALKAGGKIKINFTHPVSNINSGNKCSSYKTIPSMEDKLKGQMELADKIRAVDAADVARLVIEKHLIRDIKGNLRKFSTQQFRCSKCSDKYRRPPLTGKCLACGSRLIFTVSEGAIIKYLEPAISLSDKYNLPPYLKQVLELTKNRVEGVFGKDKDRQEGLGRWFG